jgi:hypothetical protein
MVLHLRDHPRFSWIAHVDDAETLIIRNIGVLAVFADAKLGRLVPAIEIRVRENRKILQFAINWLPSLGATKNR